MEEVIGSIPIRSTNTPPEIEALPNPGLFFSEGERCRKVLSL
jgi:hypothetical protein